MNQRTTELYQQALEFAYDNVPKEDWNADILHPIVSGKFAELIIQEYAKEYQQLVNGDSVVVPKDRAHAEALVRVGMFYLEKV